MLIPEEPLIPSGQEGRANPRAAGYAWESITVLCVGDSVPPLLQLPSHMFSPAPQLPLFPKAPSCSLPTTLSSTRSCWTGRRGRSWQAPGSPTPPWPARVPALYDRGEPSRRCLRAAQAPAAQRGADCVPEEAAPLARLCLAFIGNEDEGFGSGLCGSPQHYPAGKPAVAGQG